MKNNILFQLLLLIFPVLSIAQTEEPFWEPAQISVQANTHSLFGYFSHETSYVRKVNTQAFQSYLVAVKLNQFEMNVGIMTSKDRGHPVLNYGLSYFYRGTDQNTPFLKYALSSNWLDDWGTKVKRDHESFFYDLKRRDIGIFEIGYHYVMPHDIGLRFSSGFIQARNSEATMVAPMPIFQVGAVYSIWKTKRKIEELVFY